jgi:hypothetical protein
MTYLERYTNGEYEPVWNELQALGPAVLQEPLYSDALAVARETMRRTRRNIEELIQRLIRIGFVFGYDHHLMQIVRRIHEGLMDWTDYLESVDWVRQQPPFFFPATLMEDQFTFKVRYQPNLDPDAFRQEWRADPTNPTVMRDYLDELEQEIGPMPLSIRAWYEEVGAVNFYGYHPRWPKMSDCDPVQVCVLDKQWRIHVETAEDGNQGYAFAEDTLSKAEVSGAGGPYSFHIPDACMDARLDSWVPSPKKYGSEFTFVEYLRWSLLQWAGFPGLAGRATFAAWPEEVPPPKEELAMLTKDLIPF